MILRKARTPIVNAVLVSVVAEAEAANEATESRSTAKGLFPVPTEAESVTKALFKVSMPSQNPDAIEAEEVHESVEAALVAYRRIT